MVAMALLALAAVHPGIFFPTLRKGKRSQTDREIMTVTDREGGENSTDEGKAVSGR